MKIKIDLSNEKQFLEKIISYFIRLYSKSSYKKYVDKKSLERLEKERTEWFERKFKISVEEVKNMITRVNSVKTYDNLDTLLDSPAILFNKHQPYHSPSFVDFDVIEIHNENCDENHQTLNDIKSKDYKETEKILKRTN